MMRNSWKVIGLHYACSAQHAVVANINTHLQPYELEYILGHSQPAIVFVEACFRGRIAPAIAKLEQEGKLANCTVVWVDADDKDPCEPATEIRRITQTSWDRVRAPRPGGERSWARERDERQSPVAGDGPHPVQRRGGPVEGVHGPSPARN